MTAVVNRWGSTFGALPSPSSNTRAGRKVPVWHNPPVISERDDGPGHETRDRFEALARPLARSLYGAALRMTRSPDDARDAVQETWLRAYRTFGNFVAGTNAKAWLFTILHSILSNRLRKLASEPERVVLDEEDGRFDAALADSRVWIARDATAAPEVEQALAAISEDYRMAILLVDVEELSYEEAAAVVGCPVGTLRSRLHRGRRALYTALHEYARRMGYLK